MPVPVDLHARVRIRSKTEDVFLEPNAKTTDRKQKLKATKKREHGLIDAHENKQPQSAPTLMDDQANKPT
eukprot:10291469-Heterocapsa_arctica.AAC.1